MNLTKKSKTIKAEARGNKEITDTEEHKITIERKFVSYHLTT